MSRNIDPTAVVAFWKEAGPAKWFAKDDAFDAAIRVRFEGPHHAAARGEYNEWAETAQGLVALLILLDQFQEIFGAARRMPSPPIPRRCPSREGRWMQD